MFKKTPIALAVMLLAASVANAAPQYETISKLENGSLKPERNESTLWLVKADDQLKGQEITFQADGMTINHQNSTQVFFENFDHLKITATNDQALRFRPGDLGIGLSIKQEVLAQNPTWVDMETSTEFDCLESLTIHSDTHNAIRGRVDIPDAATSIPGTPGFKSNNSNLVIVAKHITLSTNSLDKAAVDLNGYHPDDYSAEDLKGKNPPQYEFLLTNFNHPSLEILRYDSNWEDAEDDSRAKDYGVFGDKQEMQTLKITSPREAIKLRNGALMDVQAGSVEIEGNVLLKNGTELIMGQTAKGLSSLPDAWLSYDGDTGTFVPGERPQEDYTKLINSVRIQGKIPSTEENNYRAAIHVEGGSTFWAAANDVSISGTIIPHDDTSGNNGQNRKPVNELFKQVKNHFGSDFRLLQAWQDQLDQHGHAGLVNYGNAIYLATDSSSQCQLTLENGGIKQSAIPSIVSIYGEKTLEINGDIVLDFKDHYSGSLLYIGAAEDAKVLINGDIHVYNDKNGDHENTIKLDLHEGQLFIGSIIDHTVEETQKQAKFMIRRAAPMLATAVDDAQENSNAGTHLTLRGNHSTILTSDSVITQVTTDNASIMTIDNAPVTIKQLNLQGDTDFYTFEVTPAQFKIENVTVGSAATYGLQRSRVNPPKLGFVVSNMNDKTKEQIAALVQFGTGADDGSDAINPGYTVTQNESAFGPKRVVTVESGPVSSDSIDDPVGGSITDEREDNTTVSKAINDVAGLGIMAWRAQMNDVNKRLGDLRTYQGQYGGWARVYGSESKYGDLGLKSESNTVQVGADMKIANNFYFGATASYTDGKGKLNNGSTDDRSYSFGVYGGWMGDDGQFVDVIIKEHNFKTDFDLRYTTGERSTGDFDLWGTSICAEYGWRLNVADGFWVEPQAEMTYGYMNDVTYEYAGGVKATQEATESLVGRLGVAFGTTFDRGSAYVKASVAHDWMGETEISMSNGNAPMKEDLGGTWGEFAIGGTYNFANGWAVYGEFQTAKGSKMKTPYQYNIGARYVF